MEARADPLPTLFATLLRRLAMAFAVSVGSLGAQESPASCITGNGVDITDLSGAGQCRPFTVSRVFVQGEFPTGAFPLSND